MIDHTISYGRQYITDEDIQAVVEALNLIILLRGQKLINLRVYLLNSVIVNMLVW